MSIWDDMEALDKMETQRDSMRSLGKRMTFDCFCLRYKGDRAYCSQGMRLGQARDGTISLKVVLRGITSGTCRDCTFFSTEEMDWEAL